MTTIRLVPAHHPNAPGSRYQPTVADGYPTSSTNGPAWAAKSQRSVRYPANSPAPTWHVSPGCGSVVRIPVELATCRSADMLCNGIFVTLCNHARFLPNPDYHMSGIHRLQSSVS